MRRWPVLVGCVLLASASALIASRTFNSISPPGVVDGGRLADFRDAVYLPAQAILDGENPYDTPKYMADYPEAGQDFPVYAPSLLTVFMPFQLATLEVARALHFALTVGLLVYLSYISLRWVGREGWASVLCFAALLVVSTPGRIALQTGQTTVLTAIGVFNAWRWRDRPWVAGAWLAVALLKPVVGIPIAIVFVVAHYLKPVLAGLAITFVASIPVLMVCIASAGGVSGFVESIDRNLNYFDSITAVRPQTGGSTDLVSIVAQLFSIDVSTYAWLPLSIPMFAGVLAMVWLAQRRSVTGLDVMTIAVPGILLVWYQPIYHLIMLVPVVVWVASGPTAFRNRWVITGLLSWPLLMPFATQRIAGVTDSGNFIVRNLGSPLNGMCIAAALVLIALHLLRSDEPLSSPPRLSELPTEPTRTRPG